MVAIVDELEEVGLVRRQYEPGRRRSSGLSVTCTGEEVYAAAARALGEQETEHLAPLSEPERRTLQELLERLAPSERTLFHELAEPFR